MIKDIVYTHSCSRDSIEVSPKEVMRYMGCPKDDENSKRLFDEFCSIAQNSVSPKGSFIYVSIKAEEDKVFFSNTHINSRSLAKKLEGCNFAIVFALTIGTDIDRLVAKYSSVSPSAALCINSFGAAAIEAYADKFCSEISDIMKKQSMYLRPRFSPGYCDLSLDYQPFFINLTNAGKNAGITLTDNLIMMPSKSITAIMGVGESDLECISHGCETCSNKLCKYKRQEW